MTNTAQSAAAGWYNDGSGRNRWWNGREWTSHYADQLPQNRPAQAPAPQPQLVAQPVVVNQRKMYKTSHGFHLLMSILTLGLWLPIWLIVGIYNAAKS